jgi:hypothetical protein
VTHVGTTTTEGPLAGPLAVARSYVDALRADPRAGAKSLLPATITTIAFAILFAQPFALLLRDWWTLPEAGHGLLLAPVAVWLAFKSGLRADAKGNVVLGAFMLVLAILIRYMAGLAAELFTMRASMIPARWADSRSTTTASSSFCTGGCPSCWRVSPFRCPSSITQAMALPLQFKASQMGAAMLKAARFRFASPETSSAFRATNCSSRRRAAAAVTHRVAQPRRAARRTRAQKPITRVLLVALAVPSPWPSTAVRVFLTGFLVYFVDPALGKGFMHITEGGCCSSSRSRAWGCGVAWFDDGKPLPSQARDGV